MSKLYCVGELLIDFQSIGNASLKDTKQFVKNAGGAPANVCVQAIKLGQQGVYLTKVGDDAFGEFLIDTLKAEGVDVSYISKSGDYDTSLAFVSFGEGGEREFTFYRRNAADLYFTADDFKRVTFEKDDFLEFGSVALKTPQAQKTHGYLLGRAIAAGATICFDPNVRYNLWESKEELKNVILQFKDYANVIKIGEDELEFITGKNGDCAARSMFTGNLKLLFVTNGGKGAKLYLENGKTYMQSGYKVKSVDTTGAGDSFFGAVIAQLMKSGAATKESDLSGILDFACKCGAYTTTGYGAVPAMGNKEKIDKAVK